MAKVIQDMSLRVCWRFYPAYAILLLAPPGESAAQQIPASQAYRPSNATAPHPVGHGSEGWVSAGALQPRVVAQAPIQPSFNPLATPAGRFGPSGEYVIPVRRQRWVPRWHGRWNPLTPPYMAYHLVTETSWERVATAPPAARAAAGFGPSRTAHLAAGSTSSLQGGNGLLTPAYGGVARYSNDPPRDAAQR